MMLRFILDGHYLAYPVEFIRGKLKTVDEEILQFTVHICLEGSAPF